MDGFRPGSPEPDEATIRTVRNLIVDFERLCSNHGRRERQIFMRLLDLINKDKYSELKVSDVALLSMTTDAEVRRLLAKLTSAGIVEMKRMEKSKVKKYKFAHSSDADLVIRQSR